MMYFFRLIQRSVVHLPLVKGVKNKTPRRFN